MGLGNYLYLPFIYHQNHQPIYLDLSGFWVIFFYGFDPSWKIHSPNKKSNHFGEKQ